MPFKLIVLNIKVDHKINLTPGEHIFGRDRFLHCSDKRISREHGLLIVNEDSLVLKALHNNPCFYTKKGSTETETLKLNNSITLFCGDRFGLLKDSAWYEILYMPCEDTGEQIEDTTKTNTDVHSGEETEEGNNDEIENVTVEAEIDNNIDSSGTIYNENSNDQATENNQEESTACENSSSANRTNDVTDGVQDNNNESRDVSDENQNKENENNTQSQLKRPSSTDGNDETKKIKLETEDVKPGSSNQADASNANNAPPPPQPPRERCMYGANCYRKNPRHHAQFSHPRDSDWGPGERGVCPYGASCRKTDPRHWRDHEHPPGKVPPQRPGVQAVQRQGNIFYVHANTVNFHDDNFQVEDYDRENPDNDYEF